MPKKRTKYGNRKFEADGFKWDSQREYERWRVLCHMAANGEIKDLKRQIEFVLIPSLYEDVIIQLKTKTKAKRITVQRPISYVADFSYIDAEGNYIVEDVKISPKCLPKEYVLKKKLLRYFHGIEIKEYYGKN